MDQIIEKAIQRLKAIHGESILIDLSKKEKVMLVYKIKNLITGKLYIGQRTTNDLGGDKYMGSGILIKQSLKKRGRQYFNKSILKICNTKEELDYWEKFYIKKYNSATPNGYNLNLGGSGGAMSEEVINRRRSENKYVASDEVREKIRNTLILKNKLGIIPSRKGCTMSEESRKAMSETRLRKLASGEIVLKPRVITDEFREKCRNNRLGKKLSPETIQKRTETLKRNKKLKQNG